MMIKEIVTATIELKISNTGIRRMCESFFTRINVKIVDRPFITRNIIVMKCIFSMPRKRKSAKKDTINTPKKLNAVYKIFNFKMSI